MDDTLKEAVESVASDITQWCGLESFEEEGIQDRLWELVELVQNIYDGGLVESG